MAVDFTKLRGLQLLEALNKLQASHDRALKRVAELEEFKARSIAALGEPPPLPAPAEEPQVATEGAPDLDEQQAAQLARFRADLAKATEPVDVFEEPKPEAKPKPAESKPLPPQFRRVAPPGMAFLTEEELTALESTWFSKEQIDSLRATPLTPAHKAELFKNAHLELKP